ncbi:MAG: RluA family pseudouridine synthase [Candidatus Daviesbacteria bacterium]|nr:RluA family pseudouridine synthase [Candidatus Daviesbacteria bacterium]
MVKVIFQDDYLLVLDKPPGLVVTSSETNYEKTLEDILKSDFGIKIDRGGIVHRLDKDTSGLLVVAKTAEVLEKLQAQFKERTVKKEYLTLVHGWVEKAGKIDAPILRNPGNREKFIALASQTCPPLLHSGDSRWASPCKARDAVTEYEPTNNFKFSILNFQSIFNDFNKIQMKKLERQHYGEFTLLKCFPHTGRTHQIRVHLKYIGNSVVADEKYGGRNTYRLDKRWCPRQFLHAAKLEFSHPVTGKRLIFESPLPVDLQQALGYLEKI